MKTGIWQTLERIGLVVVIIQAIGSIMDQTGILPGKLAKFTVTNPLFLWLIILALIIYLLLFRRSAMLGYQLKARGDKGTGRLIESLDDILKSLEGPLHSNDHSIKYVFMHLSTTNLGDQSIQDSFHQLRERSEIIEYWFMNFIDAFRKFKKDASKDFLIQRIEELNWLYQAINGKIVSELALLREKLGTFRPVEREYGVLRDEYNQCATDYGKFLMDVIKEYGGGLVNGCRIERMPK